MKIAVIGTGYVGLVAGTCLADLGNDGICVDIDEQKIGQLKKGILPIYEPGLGDLLKRNLSEKRIQFTTDGDEAIRKSEIIFIAVATPTGKSYEADLSIVEAVAKQIGKNLNGYKVIVIKSTVPVGTTSRVKEIIKAISKNKDFDVVSNPEFLREGEAVNDFTFPDRVVIGVENGNARQIMEKLYAGIARTNHPILFTDIRSAEIIKYASNAMLATRISFMNEIANLCEKVGADVKEVARGIGLDARIGPRFLQAGAGYGGSCFPKDVKALIHTMKGNGVQGKILEAVEAVNEAQKASIVPKLKKLVPDLKGKKIALWGLAFKPKTDDMREATSLVLIHQLQKEGAKINAFDPEATRTAKKIFKDVAYFEDPYETVKDCEALIIVTEWNTFRDLDKEKIRRLLAKPNIVDGRNVYDPKEMKELGFNYIGIRSEEHTSEL